MYTKHIEVFECSGAENHRTIWRETHNENDCYHNNHLHYTLLLGGHATCEYRRLLLSFCYHVPGDRALSPSRRPPQMDVQEDRTSHNNDEC